MDRFENQLGLPGFGVEGQAKLKHASVLVIGAGGLGCPTLVYLAAAGVGRIAVVDGGEVTLPQLNTQVLYGEKDLGKNKAETAVRHFQEKYSDIHWKAIPEFISVENAQELIFHYDVIIDCTDYFPLHFLVSDACVLLKKSLVFGATSPFEGQLGVFNHGPDACHFRDAYPTTPEITQSSALGALSGIIGSIMALETIKLLSGMGQTLQNKLLFFNSLTSQYHEVEITPNPAGRSAIPGSWDVFQQRNYALKDDTGVVQLTWNEAMKLMNQEVAFVDVRELGELPPLDCTGLVKVPFSELPGQLERFEDSEEVLFFCQGGTRSQKAAQLLQQAYPDKKIYAIRGGINALKS